MTAKPRSQRILDYLVANPRGVNIHQVRDKVEPDAKIQVISAQMCQLVDAGKAKRTGAARSSTFFPTPLSLVDRRSLAAQKRPKPHPKPKAPALAKAAKPVRKREPTAPPSPPASSPLRLAVTRSPTGHRHVIDSDQLAADVAEFLQRGGRIQYCAPGESSQTKREADEAFLASRRRGRSKQQAEGAKARPGAPLFDDDDADDELAAA